MPTSYILFKNSYLLPLIKARIKSHESISFAPGRFIIRLFNSYRR